MRKLWIILAFLSAPALAQNLAVNGDCTVGGQAVVVQNLKEKGTTPIPPGGPIAPNSGVMASYPGCTVSVFATGTTNTVPLFSNASGSQPLPDPFIANTTTGQWLFYIASGTYDVMVSGAGIPSPRTWTAIQPGGGGGGGGAFLPLAGGTMLGEEITAPSSAANAGLNLPNGTAPNVCVNGDLWTTSLGLFECNNGVAVGPFGTGSGSLLTAGLTVPVGFTVTNSPLTGSGGTLNMITTGLTSNRLIKAVTGGLGNSLFSDDGTNGTYTGTGGLFSPIITTTGVCPGAGSAVGCFDVGVGTPAPNNPPAGFDRFYGDSGTGNVLCKTSSGNPCFASGQNITASAPIVVTPSPLTGAGTISCPTCGTGSGNFSATGTNNIVVKFTGANTGGNSSITDDGSTPTKTPNGVDAGTTAGHDNEIANNAVTGTTNQFMVCPDGSQKGIICSHTTSTTNVPFGAAVTGGGTAGNVTFCILGWCQVKFDNSTTAGHWAIASSTTDGELHDNGASEVSGQPNYKIVSANGGAGNAAYYEMITPDEIAAGNLTPCPTCVVNNGANTGTAAMTLNMAASTTASAFRVPAQAGLTSAADGVVAYDTTAKLTHVRTNGADSTPLAQTATTTTSGKMVQSTATAGLYATNDFPDIKIIPLCASAGGTAAAGVTYATGQWTPTNRAGTNNVGCALQAIPATGATLYTNSFLFLPSDWDSASQPFITMMYGSGANTSGTVIWTVSSACTKQDGSVTDDPAFVAESAFGSQTMAVANRAWAKNGQFANVTSGNNCIAGSPILFKIVLSGTAASAINLYQIAIVSPRLPVVQAQ